jgi:hypothetical protein
MGEIGKVNPALEMAAIKPYLILQEDKAFQAWLKTIEGELDKLKEFSWQIGGLDQYGRFDAALNEMDMVRPTSQRELMQIWMCFRAVANYWGAKMQFLKRMRVKYEFFEKQLKMVNKIEAKDKKREDLKDE